jgi:hypothetical protein
MVNTIAVFVATRWAKLIEFARKGMRILHAYFIKSSNSTKGDTNEKAI